MNKRKFYVMIICFVMVICAIILCPQNVNVASAASLKDVNVVYNAFEKHIVIDKSKNLEVTELVTVTYKQAGINVGLTRNVSRINNITRKYNNKKYSTKTVSELKLQSVTMDGVEEYAFLETSGDYYLIQIGQNGDYKQGKHVYEIKYTYAMGEDFIKAFDDFTYDLLDYGFSGKVGSFKSSITFPQEFDANNITLRTSLTNDIDPDLVNLNVTYNTISLSIDDASTLPGLTIQVILPNKYFDTSFTPNGLYIATLIISIVAMVSIIAIIIINRRNKTGVIPVEFYPPKDYSPLDVARCYKSKVNNKDLASLVIYWASKHYIKLEFVSNNNIRLTKLKDLDINATDNLKAYKENEQDYFKALFKDGDVFETATLKSKYCAAIQLAMTKLTETPKDKKQTLSKYRVPLHLLATLPIIMYCIWNVLLNSSNTFLFMILLFPIIAIFVAIYIKMPIWFKLLWCGLFGGLPLVMMIIGFSLSYDIYYLSIITAIILVVGNFGALLIRAYSSDELENRARVLGFRNFLITAELDKLKKLLSSDPEYFYNILPYCYVLGITKQMQHKFDELNIKMDNMDINNYTALYISLSHSFYYVRSTSPNRNIHFSGGGSIGSAGGGGGGGGFHGR